MARRFLADEKTISWIAVLREYGAVDSFEEFHSYIRLTSRLSEERILKFAMGFPEGEDEIHALYAVYDLQGNRYQYGCNKKDIGFACVKELILKSLPEKIVNYIASVV